MTDRPACDPDEIARDGLDDDKGYHVIKGMFTPDEIEAYRNECDECFGRAQIRHGKFFYPGLEDYVQPWMYDKKLKKYFNYRLYQFLHNEHSEATSSLFERILSVRDAVEERWPANDEYYQRAGQHDYVIVTKYVPGIGRYPRHSDDTSGHPHPLLQSLLLLSDPEVDYIGGDLNIYTKTGRELKSHRDLGLVKGDCLYFDKQLDHSVDRTDPSPTSSVGRWVALVGAKITHRVPPSLPRRVAKSVVKSLLRLNPRA